MAYFIYWSSFLRVFPPIGNEDFDHQDPGFIIDYDNYYMPDEDINEFLETYLENSEGSDLDLESLTEEFNLFTVYIVFCKFWVEKIAKSFLDLGQGPREGLKPSPPCPNNDFFSEYIQKWIVWGN